MGKGNGIGLHKHRKIRADHQSKRGRLYNQPSRHNPRLPQRFIVPGAIPKPFRL